VHRLAIELTNANETETIAADRAARRAWLESRGYAVIDIKAFDVEADLARELTRLEASLSSNS
jgi:tRNA/rRNA methyltransferase